MNCSISPFIKVNRRSPLRRLGKGEESFNSSFPLKNHRVEAVGTKLSTSEVFCTSTHLPFHPFYTYVLRKYSVPGVGDKRVNKTQSSPPRNSQARDEHVD